MLKELAFKGFQSTKPEAFTSAKADIIFQRCSAMEEGANNLPSPEKRNEKLGLPPKTQASLGHDKQLEFSEFLVVMSMVAEEAFPKSGMEGLMKKVLPLLEKIVAATRAKQAGSFQTTATEGLEQLPVVVKNRKQLDTIYEYYCKSSNQHHRAGGKNVKTAGLSFKGLQTLMRDFELIQSHLPAVFASLSDAQDIFHIVNHGSGSADVLSQRRFLDFLDRTAQIHAAKVTEKAAGAEPFQMLLERMENSGGRSKLSSARNGVMLRPFALPSAKSQDKAARGAKGSAPAKSSRLSTSTKAAPKLGLGEPRVGKLAGMSKRRISGVGAPVA